MRVVIKMEQLTFLITKEDEETLESIRCKLEELCFMKKKIYVTIDSKVFLSPPFIHRMLSLFFDYHSALLKSIIVPKKERIRMIKQNLHNGEIWHLKETTILVGDIHEDAIVYVEKMLYVSGIVKGKIYLENAQSEIFADEMEHAKIVFLEDVTRIVDGKNELWNQEKKGETTWRELSLSPVVKVE